MATIILAKDGVMLQTLALLKERTTIGRSSDNDIVIAAPSISAEHAVIISVANETYFEDLDSTNGSRLDGKTVKKHLLQDRDEIALATHTIRYDAHGSAHDAANLDYSALQAADDIRQIAVPTSAQIGEQAKPRPAVATIKILNGINKNKEVRLTKIMTTVGWPGVQVAVVNSTPQGYSLTHVEGKAYPSVNGVSIGEKTQALINGDVITLSGTEMLFVH